MFDTLPLDILVGELGKAARADTSFVSDDDLTALAKGLEDARRLLDATSWPASKRPRRVMSGSG